MSNDSKRRFLSYGENPLSAIVITLISLFAQWANWFVYEKAGYSLGYTLVTPIVLCLMYHFVQLDAGKNDNFSRKFFFIFAVAVPLLFGILLTLLMFFTNPDISSFNSEAEYKGSVKEQIAVYSGRFIFTSLYLLIFAIADIPVLKYLDKKGK